MSTIYPYLHIMNNEIRNLLTLRQTARFCREKFERILISCRCWPRHQTIVLVAGPHLHVYRPLMVLIPRTSLPVSYESFVTLSRALVSSANPNANAIWVAFYFTHCFRALFACACCNKFAAFSLCDSCTSFATK